MNIAIDASRATRVQPTGTETYARRLIERLVTARPEVRWTLYFRDDPGEWLADRENVTRVVLPATRMWTYRALAPALAHARPDLFWEPAHVLPPSVPFLGIPSLVTVHDLGFEHFPAAHTVAQRAYLRLTTRYHALAATRIIADSRATRADLVRHYRTPEGKIGVVPLGVAHEHFQPVTNADRIASIREQYQTGSRYILYVGTLQPRKNLERLIRAFALVAPHFPEVNLILAGGKGWLSDDLQRVALESGVAQRVVTTGYVDAMDLPGLLSGAELFAFPSLFEGFGLPALEAMACGTAVVCSNSSSLPDVVGDAAIGVDPMDEQQIGAALALVLGQPALRAELERRGIERAASFTWEASAAKVWEEMQSLLEASRRISVLGLPIDNLAWDETVQAIGEMVETGTVHQIVTANPEFLMRARGEAPFMDVLRRADMVLADGVGLLLAARWQRKRFRAQITGSDLTPKLAALAAERGWHLYLLGAAEGVAERAAAKLREAHPTLRVTADGSDPFPDGPPELVARIRTARPHILLVAYGAPKQDYWIDQFGRSTGVPVQIGIGGSLDFVAGIVTRAPVLWRRVGLEWLWRLVQEPWRWRRMLALPRFALLAALDAMNRLRVD